jgi:hypothetical protein
MYTYLTLLNLHNLKFLDVFHPNSLKPNNLYNLKFLEMFDPNIYKLGNMMKAITRFHRKCLLSYPFPPSCLNFPQVGLGFKG